MSRDRRSASQHSPSFVWESLDSAAHDRSPVQGREDALAETESEDAEEGGRREHAPRRASGRVLIAAAVLVPLAGGSYALIAGSIRHDGAAIVSAGGDPAASAAALRPGAGSSASASQGASTGLKSSRSPSAGTSATAAAGPTHGPSQPATSVAASPERTTATAAPTTPKATAKTAPTQTKASRPSCAAAWSSSVSYSPGQVVSYQGQNYTAIYYSTNAAPNAAISWNLWTDNGSCAS